MRSRIWLSLLVMALSRPALAAPCDDTIRPIIPNTVLAQTVSRAFADHGNMRGQRIQASSEAYALFSVKNCGSRNGRSQQLSIRYRASGILRGASNPQSYSCGTTLKRRELRPTRWSNWQHIKTGCVQAISRRFDPFEDSVPESDYLPGSPSPDEISDGEERRGGGGIDDVDDGSGSRDSDSDDEFGDLYH